MLVTTATSGLRFAEVELGSGVQTTTAQTPRAGGNAVVNPTDYPAGARFYFEVIYSVAAPGQVQAKLYDRTAGAYVAGSLLASNSATPASERVEVALPAAAHQYEAHFCQTVVGIPTTAATIARASIRAEW